MSRPHINNVGDFYCQDQPQLQLQQSPISNCAELDPAQPQHVIRISQSYNCMGEEKMTCSAQFN